MFYTHSALLRLLSCLLFVFAHYEEVADDCAVMTVATFCLLCYLFVLFLSHLNGSNCLKDQPLFSSGVSTCSEDDEDGNVIVHFCYVCYFFIASLFGTLNCSHNCGHFAYSVALLSSFSFLSVH